MTRYPHQTQESRKIPGRSSAFRHTESEDIVLESDIGIISNNITGSYPEA